jgi:geranylgeranyl pyrophosphate synthase
MSEPAKKDELNIEEYMENLRKKVDDRIDYITEKYEFLDFLEPIRYTMVGQKGGKKLRPTIATLMNQALGGHDDEKTLEVSVIVELLHQGSLVIDDMLDGDSERRGQQALWMIEQAGKTAVGGLIMFLFANKIGAHRVPRAKDLVMETIEIMAKGNSADVSGFGWDEEAYMKMIYGKTAFLFGASAKFGAIMADASDIVISKAFDYGKNVGMLYQLTDDLVDILKTRKVCVPMGDMKRGKVTHVMLTMYKANKKAHKLLEKYKNKQLAVDDLEAFFDTVDKTGAIQAAEDLIEVHANTAISMLSSFPNNKYTNALKRLPEFMKQALLKEV